MCAKAQPAKLVNKHGHYNKQSDRKRSLEKVCNEQKSLRCSWDMKGYKE